MSVTRAIESDPQITQIGTTRRKFAANFAGPNLAAGQASIDDLVGSGWQVVRNTGVTVTLTNNTLVLGLGTANGNEFMLVAPSLQTIPANLIAILQLSQRIAGNEVRFGYVEIDPSTGLPVPHPSIAGEFRNYTAALFNGTTATTAVLEAMGGGATAKRSVTVASMATTASAADYALEARNEDVTLLSQVADNVAARTSGAGRISSMVPNPSLTYAPFIWVRNISAAASNTNVTFSRIVAVDIQELQAEVGGGRGNITPSQAVPVALVSGGNAVAVSGTAAVTGSGVATTNGLTPHKLISAASTNLTSVKTTAGRVSGGILTNASASWRYVKFFNKNSAPVIPTDVPILTIGIPPNGQLNLGSVFDQYGLFFAAGIAYAITGAPADADTTAVGANEVVVALLFA
jgi:hypothetical protein